MAKIQVSQFQGIAPRIDARLLGERQGQIAENLKLTSFALQSWREPVVTETPALATPALETIYLYKGYGSDLWLTWTVDVDVVQAPLSNDTTDRLYWSGDGKPKMGDNANDTVTGINGPGGSGIYPENSVTLGAPAPTAAPTVALGTGGAGTNPTGKIYVYTFISQFGEESAPSPASAIINVDHNTGGDIDLSAMETTWAAEYNTLDKIRIYRSSSGVNSSAYRFVAEISPSSTYTDGLADTGLGEVISTTDYDLPPDDIFGLLDFGNGILIGFTEYEVLFSEPFQPHAWPVKYRLAVVDKIVGGGVFGNTLVVCTDGKPVLVVGNHPSTMTMTLHPDIQSCVSKQGIVSTRNRVIYPSPDGLYSIGYGGSGLITEPLYDRETWQLRNPSQLRSARWDTRYIGFTDDKGIVVETANGNIAASDFNIDVDAIYNDSENDVLYISQVDKFGNNQILKFNAGGVRQPYKWRSKKYSLGSLVTLTAGKILAKYGALLTQPEIDALNQLIADIVAANAVLLAGEIYGDINSHEIHENQVDGAEIVINGSILQTPPSEPSTQNVVLRLYGDGNFIGTATTTDDEPFRLPAGKRYRQYEIEIETFTDVNQITLGSSITELLQA